MKIGVIGLGKMGSGMAQSLLREGFEVTVYNRTASKAEALGAEGAHIASTPGEAARGDAVLTMVSDDGALEGAAYGPDGFLEAMPRGALHISSSTVSVDLVEKLNTEHTARGHFMVSAPVFGRPHVAAAGQLFIAAGGSADAMERAGPILNALGRQTNLVGDTPQAAALVKLAGNFLIGSVIEGLGEAMTLVSKGGVDRHAFLEFLTTTLFDAPIYKIYGQLIADNTYTPPGFAAPLAKKDMGLALTAAEDLEVPMPLCSLIRDRLIALMAQGGEDLDFAAMAKLAAQDAGLKG